MNSFCLQGCLYGKFVTSGTETNMGYREKICLPGLESLSSLKSLFSQEVDVAAPLSKSQSWC